MLFNLFENKSFIILFWVHFLAMNLFCGGWIVKDSQKFGMNKISNIISTYNNIFYWSYWINSILDNKNILRKKN